jgi:trehalose synthase
MHNGLQGHRTPIADSLLKAYEEVNRKNAEQLRPQLEEADFVFIHDPQPAPLLGLCPNRRGRWVWRCHIDASRPYRPLWRYLRGHISPYDASIFSLPAFAQSLPHPEYIIAPSIDPLSEKILTWTPPSLMKSGAGLNWIRTGPDSAGLPL